ncbi:hypothetical protein J6590_026433 [Homalodisca vitripennis]|nr:hypothetical protein J6590_026433 [Homalodisca vitripennis]
MKPSIRVYNSLNQRTTGTNQARLCVTETDRSADLPECIIASISVQPAQTKLGSVSPRLIGALICRVFHVIHIIVYNSSDYSL